MQPQQVWRESPQRYRLEAARCSRCKAVFFPPRRKCRSCGGEEFSTIRLPREGRLVAFTVVRAAPEKQARLAPYGLGIVELEGGVRLTVPIADAEPEELRTGLRVRLEFRRLREEGRAGVICYGHKAVPVEP